MPSLPFSEFELTASPPHWLEIAKDLHDQAHALNRTDLGIVQYTNPRGHTTTRPRTNRGVFLLAGFALENLLKSYLIFENPSYVANGVLAKVIRTHTHDLARRPVLVHCRNRCADRRVHLGEAKNRGSEGDRNAQALGRAVAPAPPMIKCNVCGALLPEPDRIDVKALKGIEVAYRAHCTGCDQDTWAVRGDSASVRAFFDTLEKTSGRQVQLGTARPASND